VFFLEHGVHPGHALGGGQRLRLHGSSITGVGYDRKALPFTLTLQAAGLSSDEARSALGSNPISMEDAGGSASVNEDGCSKRFGAVSTISRR